MFFTVIMVALEHRRDRNKTPPLLRLGMHSVQVFNHSHSLLTTVFVLAAFVFDFETSLSMFKFVYGDLHNADIGKKKIRLMAYNVKTFGFSHNLHMAYQVNSWPRKIHNQKLKLECQFKFHIYLFSHLDQQTTLAIKGVSKMMNEWTFYLIFNVKLPLICKRTLHRSLLICPCKKVS